MKKFSLFLFLICIWCIITSCLLTASCSNKKQQTESSLCFLDVPISGDIKEFANILEKKGFEKDKKFDGILNSKMYGNYNGFPCTLVIGHSMKGEALAVYLRFHKYYEIQKIDKESKESFVDLDSSDSLKSDFEIHKDYLEKTYSIKLETLDAAKKDTVKILPWGHDKWMGNGFIRIDPKSINMKYYIIVLFRGSGDDSITNDDEINTIEE